jgi:excisionase family DNA binding protein
VNLKESARLSAEFRRAGYTFAEIGELFDCDATLIRRLIKSTATEDSHQINYLTPAAVAKMLGIGVKKVRKLAATGALRASNVSESRRPRLVIRREDVDAFLAKRQVEPLQQRVRRRPRLITKSERY